VRTDEATFIETFGAILRGHSMAFRVESGIEKIIFGSRWIQLPIYLALVAVQCLYAYRFVVETIHLATGVMTLSESFFMQSVLALIDIVMVVNLVTMVIIGGWTTFVSKLELDDNPDKPRWLGHIDPGTLKTKLAGALVGISGIHLLKTFIQLSDGGDTISTERVIFQIAIHLAFVISTVVVAVADLYVQKKISLDFSHHAPR
jgi:uncharacterized protein (TIGR00645 family)